MTDNPSFVEYIGNGSQTDFVFPFSYLRDGHIFVTVVGVDRAFTLPSQNTVRISPAPTGLVRISRETPGEALVTFADGAVILGKDLNTSGTQPRYIAEEARDIATEAKGIALSSVTDAEEFAEDAEASATAAAVSAASAATTKLLVDAIYDSFDDRYLGLKTADPTVDNDGAALVVGAIYFNTTLQSLRLFTSSGWQSAYIPTDGTVLSFNGRTGSVVPVSGDYDVAKITGLQTALDAKAALSHTHSIANVTGLQTALDGKAATGHTHPNPTVQRFTAGSGTYTPSPGARYIRVRMVGGGGGGAAQTTNAGVTGAVTSFGGWVAFAGNGGTPGGPGGPGASGGADGTGTLITRIAGADGTSGAAFNPTSSGAGGSSVFGGAGAYRDRAPGLAAKANTGSGGGAGGTASSAASGGGGAGEYVEFFVSAPSATAYTVGTGGAGGPAGTQAGGAGASGVIIVEEYY